MYTYIVFSLRASASERLRKAGEERERERAGKELFAQTFILYRRARSTTTHLEEVVVVVAVVLVFVTIVL